MSFVSGISGSLSNVLLGVENHNGMWDYAGLPGRLPAGGNYSLNARMSMAGATAAATGWALGRYRFENYKSENLVNFPP